MYEALTGRLPFDGMPISVLFQKTQGPPPPPSKHAAGVPEDLEKLAMDLLARDPRDRPTATDVLARLARSSAPPREDSADSLPSIR